MDKYYTNIKDLIERDVVEQTKHQIRSNNHKVMTYHQIGRELVEAESDVENKYGARIIKKYAIDLKEKYGPGYSESNLKKMRKFYLLFPDIIPSVEVYSQNSSPTANQSNSLNKSIVSNRLSYSHFAEVLFLDDENERNYYLNLVVEHNLSRDKLRKQIKSDAYNRLAKKGDIKPKYLCEKIDDVPNIMDMIKNPILIGLNDNLNKINERIIKELIIEQIEKFMLEAGYGFAFVGSEVPIRLDGKIHKPDLVFFNIELNCYVIVELKLEDLKKSDIGQIEFYINYYDADVKKPFHNPTIGVTISKRIDANIEKYNYKPNIKHATYELVENK